MKVCDECDGTGTTRSSEESMRWVPCPVCLGCGEKPLDASGRLRRIDQLEKKVSALQKMTTGLRSTLLDLKELVDKMRKID